MIKAILNEVKHIAVKKRFIILSALLFLWMIVWAVLAKTDYFNDHIYTVKMQRFLRIFFKPAVVCILLFAQYRRTFTKTLVEEAKERKLGSIKLVISRWCAGVAVLFTYYLIAWLFILLLSLILGAHCTGAEIWALTLYVFFGWILAVGSYGIALLFMYLIPFFLPAWLFYGFFAGVAPIILFSVDAPGYPLIRFLDQFLISYYTEAGYTAGTLGQTRWGFLLILLIYTAISFGLSILFFHLKKKRIMKKAKAAEGTDSAESVESAEMTGETGNE